MSRAESWQDLADFAERRLGPFLGHPHSVQQLALHPTRALAVGVADVRQTLLGPVSSSITLFEDGEHRAVRVGHSPAWSPDGATLAHLTAGGVQIGDFHRELDGLPERLSWKADGSAVVLVLAATGSDISTLAGSGDPARVEADSWQPTVSGATPTSWRRAVVIDARTGHAELASRADLNVWDACWAGDLLLAVCSDGDPSESAWYTADLRLLDPATHDDTVLVCPPAQLGPIAASPSGRLIAFVSSVASDRDLVAGDLMVLDRETQQCTHWAPGVDVSSIAFTGEHEVGYAGLTGLVTRLGFAKADGARATWSAEDRTAAGYHPTAAFAVGRAAWVCQGFRQGPQVMIDDEVICDLDRTAPETGTLSPYRWETTDGLEIEGWLHLPEGPGPHPLVVFVHGGPVASTRSTWTPVSLLRPYLAEQGYAMLLPNPRGSTGRGQSFTSAVVGDMGGADALDITSGVSALVDAGLADPERVGVIGGSYGGFMTSWLVTQVDVFAAAVAQYPICDWREQHGSSSIPAWDELFLDGKPYATDGQYVGRSPLTHAAEVRTPTLFIAGGLDRATPAGQAIAMHRALLANGVPSECAVYPESGHGTHHLASAIDLNARTAAWFARFMPATSQARA